MSIPLIILGFILFVGLVVLHELGHFLVARRNDVEVEEFGIGFPPRAKVLARKKGTVYTLNWLPLGGFVKLKGEHDSDTEKGTFGAAPLWAKVKIMLAGVVINALTAFVMLTILAAVGLPRILENQFTVQSDTKIIQHDVLVGFVEKDSPAVEAGIKEEEQLIAIGLPNAQKESVSSAERMSELTQMFAGSEVEVTIKNEELERTVKAQLRTKEEVESFNTENHCDDENAKDEERKCIGVLGIAPAEYVVQRSTWSSPVVALGFMKQITEATFKGLGSALSGIAQGDGKKASEQVSGIVGIGYIIGKGSALGLQFILLIIAIISLTLALMNVLPIPALDGGRLFVTLLFRVIKKPLTQRKEEWIHGTGFVLLMLLFVLITIVDINRFT